MESFKPAFWEVCKIITAFTLAHSITLSLAVLGIVNLPSRWVESVIAASVLLVALHNLYPVIQARLWIVTFVFGLIHGLGFASVLLDLEIPGTSLLLALAGFNLGVETGQIAIVGILLPSVIPPSSHLVLSTSHSGIRFSAHCRGGITLVVGAQS